MLLRKLLNQHYLTRPIITKLNYSMYCTSFNYNFKQNFYLRYQGCALVAPGSLRRLTFGLGRLKKKKAVARLGIYQQTYRNGMEQNKKKLHSAPRLPLAPEKQDVYQHHIWRLVITRKCNHSIKFDKNENFNIRTLLFRNLFNWSSKKFS